MKNPSRLEQSFRSAKEIRQAFSENPEALKLFDVLSAPGERLEEPTNPELLDDLEDRFRESLVENDGRVDADLGRVLLEVCFEEDRHELLDRMKFVHATIQLGIANVGVTQFRAARRQRGEGQASDETAHAGFRP